MYKIIIEECPHEEITKVFVENVIITFEGENSKDSAHKFVLDLLKDTGRIGY